MRRIFVNAALMHLRKGDALRHTEELDGPAGNVETITDYGVLEQISSREILDLIAELPSGLRNTFNLFVLDGYTHAEVAELLGITEQTSRSQVSRARTMLQEKIKKLYNDRK